MKIVLVIPSLELAGAETMCANLAIELKQNNNEVYVVSLYNRKTVLSDSIERNGITIKYCKKKLGFDPRMFFVLKAYLGKVKPEVIHTHLDCIKYVAPVAHIKRIPVRIHTIHSLADKNASGIVKRINYFAFHYLRFLPIALSSEVQESISNYYNIKKVDIPIIYNGIDLSKCIPKDTYDTNKLIFVNVARFSTPKNHKMTIDTFSKYVEKYPQSELWLIGCGELCESIKISVNKYKIQDKVKFLGERTDVFEVINKADVFILPSIYEGMPISIIEAMGTGLPIIASNVGGIPAMINKETGILIECESDKLLEAMIVMRNKKIREKLGRNALEEVHKKFSVELMTKSYLDIYKDVLEG